MRTTNGHKEKEISSDRLSKEVLNDNMPQRVDIISVRSFKWIYTIRKGNVFFFRK